MNIVTTPDQTTPDAPFPNVWSCPEGCGYHIADGPVPDDEPTTSELIRDHIEWHDGQYAAERAAYVAGLRELADWWEQHTDIPVERHMRIAYLPEFAGPAVDDDEDGAARVATFAAALGTTVTISESTHVRAHRQFGPIEVDATYVPRQAMADHRAEQELLKRVRRGAPDDALTAVATADAVLMPAVASEAADVILGRLSNLDPDERRAILSAADRIPAVV